MAIAFIGAGTFSENNNADGTPGLHASTAQNDLIICSFILRGLNADANPMALVGVSGYTQLFNFIHSTGSPCPRLGVFYKIAGASESSPTIDITPLGTGCTVIGQTCTFRGIDTSDPIDISGATSENASAANIGPITGISGTVTDGAVIVVGARCDDWTSVADLSGDSLTWAEIGEPISILGQDAGLVWDYAIWSGSGPTITDKTFSVTGGAANKGLGVMFSINPAPPGTGQPTVKRAGGVPGMYSNNSQGGSVW